MRENRPREAVAVAQRADAPLSGGEPEALRLAPQAEGGEDRLGTIAYKVVALLFLVSGIWACWTAYNLTYYSPIGPGPGYFPFWAGALLVFSALIVLLNALSGKRAQIVQRFLPTSEAVRPTVMTVACVVGFALLVERIGFVFTIFAILFALLISNRCRLFPTAILVALGGSFGVGYTFQHWLGVYLPPAPGGILSFLGL